MRQLLDALFYLARTGCPWRHLPPPPAFPPDAALGQEQFDIAEAERERVIEPDRVGDDRGREAVAVVRVRRSSHPPTLADPGPASHPLT